MKESKNDQDFFRIATVASMIAMGATGAMLGSLKGIGENFGLQFSFWTFGGAAIGTFVGWAIWKVARVLSEREQRTK